MPTLTLDTAIKIHFTWDKGEEGTATSPHVPPSIQIGQIDLPSDEEIEEFLWEAKDEWKED